MKKLLIILLCVYTSLTGLAQDFPPRPNTLVNDYTGTLSAEQKSALERKLVAFDDSTSIQVAVVLIRSLDGYDISDYGYRLGREWGIGGKEKNTGVLILSALEDRKVTIQTGYGMEGMLPDIITKRIIDNEIKPYYRSGRYYEGLDAATSAIISYNKGEYKGNGPKNASDGIPVGLIVLIAIIVISLIGRGGNGGGRNVIGGRGGADIFWWSVLSGMGNSSRGGGFGGGGFGGGSGGGFGGFGGGSFGGGGSSGSW